MICFIGILAAGISVSFRQKATVVPDKVKEFQ